MNSDDHFQGLVSYLIASINERLKTNNIFMPIALVVNSNKSIEVVNAEIDTLKTLEHVELIQKKLQAKAYNFEIISSCIAYPDYEKNTIVVYLENDENYCVKVLIPVVNRGGLKLNPEKLTTQTGAVYVFPIKKIH